MSDDQISDSDDDVSLAAWVGDRLYPKLSPAAKSRLKYHRRVFESGVSHRIEEAHLDDAGADGDDRQITVRIVDESVAGHYNRRAVAADDVQETRRWGRRFLVKMLASIVAGFLPVLLAIFKVADDPFWLGLLVGVGLALAVIGALATVAQEVLEGALTRSSAEARK